MKSPSTLIPILEKCVAIQEALATVNTRIDDSINSHYYHKNTWNTSLASWYKSRYDINVAIKKRLEQYYCDTIQKAVQYKETGVIASTPTVESMNC